MSKRKTNQPNRQSTVESLETRRMLAVGLTLDVTPGANNASGTGQEHQHHHKTDATTDSSEQGPQLATTLVLPPPVQTVVAPVIPDLGQGNGGADSGGSGIASDYLGDVNAGDSVGSSDGGDAGVSASGSNGEAGATSVGEGIPQIVFDDSTSSADDTGVVTGADPSTPIDPLTFADPVAADPTASDGGVIASEPGNDPAAGLPTIDPIIDPSIDPTVDPTTIAASGDLTINPIIDPTTDPIATITIDPTGDSTALDGSSGSDGSTADGSSGDSSITDVTTVADDTPATTPLPGDTGDTNDTGGTADTGDVTTVATSAPASTPTATDDSSNPLDGVTTAGSSDSSTPTQPATTVVQVAQSSGSDDLNIDPGMIHLSLPPIMTGMHDVMSNHPVFLAPTSHTSAPAPATTGRTADGDDGTAAAKSAPATSDQSATTVSTLSVTPDASTTAAATSSQNHVGSAAASSASTTPLVAPPFSSTLIHPSEAATAVAAANVLPPADQVITVDRSAELAGARDAQGTPLTAEDRFKMAKLVWTFDSPAQQQQAEKAQAAAQQQQQEAQTAAAVVANAQPPGEQGPQIIQIVQELDVTPDGADANVAIAVDGQQASGQVVNVPTIRAGVAGDLNDPAARSRNVLLAVFAGLASMAVQWWRAYKRKMAAASRAARSMFDPLGAWLDDSGYHED